MTPLARKIEYAFRVGRSRNQNSQSSKLGLDALVTDIMAHAKMLVEVTGLTELPVCFVNRVEQVCQNDGYVNSLAVVRKGTRSRLRFWIACSNPYGIVGSLRPASDKLV